MQTGSQEALVTRERSAETGAECLEEETAETADAENDPSDSERDEFACRVEALGR